MPCHAIITEKGKIDYDPVNILIIKHCNHDDNNIVKCQTEQSGRCAIIGILYLYFLFL